MLKTKNEDINQKHAKLGKFSKISYLIYLVDELQTKDELISKTTSEVSQYAYNITI